MSRWILRNEFKFRILSGLKKHKIGNTNSPVVKMSTLKILSNHCQRSLEIEQMDVETAFLIGKENSKVYVHQPKNYIMVQTKFVG